MQIIRRLVAICLLRVALNCILCSILCLPGFAQSQEDRQRLDKNTKLLDLVVKSFITSIQSGDLRGAFSQISDPTGSRANPKNGDFQRFSTFVKASPVFNTDTKYAVIFTQFSLSDGETGSGTLLVRFTLRTGETYDGLFEVRNAPKGWFIEYFIVGKQFPIE